MSKPDYGLQKAVGKSSYKDKNEKMEESGRRDGGFLEESGRVDVRKQSNIPADAKY